jgi:hypothetical protein
VDTSSLSLTTRDKNTIAEAHLLARLRDSEAIRRHAGEDDILLAYALTLSQAQHCLAEMAGIIGRLADTGQE